MVLNIIIMNQKKITTTYYLKTKGSNDVFIDI